ncbi:hypothetical protein V6N13_076389 [Hibiscus sabdariffa]|uniref:PB1 domain-containing protein n=1 Tax=Hibiscus sabdariffa TaxID=183260 RepID=A0ABR2ABE4_9ROSI
MDSPSLSPESALPSSTAASNDAIPRVKILCSFLGSILPRPQDGKLRYVGGETHIVSVPRDITYAKLMTKMRELYCGAAVLKYQQPDEDLDALTLLTNDEDVINMMEECEKLASRDRFCRLRIFLFLHPEQDGLSPFVYGNERRFVDALNSLNVGSDFRKYGHNGLHSIHMNLPLEHGNLSEGHHHMLSNYVLQRAGSALGNEVFVDPVVASPHTHIPLEEHGAAWYGGDNVYQPLRAHAHPLRRNVQNQNHGAPAYEACSLVQQVNSAVNAACFKDPAECSARHHVATDGQNPWVGSPEKVLSSDGVVVPDIDYANVPHCQETQDTLTSERVHAPQDMLKFVS